jgi:hypothetical protein
MQINELIHHRNNPGSLTKETLAGLKKTIEEFPFFQGALILYLKNLHTLKHPDFRQELERLAIRIPDRKKLFYCLNPEQQNKPAGSVAPVPEGILPKAFFPDETNAFDEKNDKNDLIQKFINSGDSFRLTSQPETEIPRKDLSQKSVSENREIITETFAELLVQQKKYEKAMEAFRQLSLKFPEKSIYFADRMEEIRKLENL